MEKEKLEREKTKLTTTIKTCNRQIREQFRERQVFDDTNQLNDNELDADDDDEFESARSDPITARHSLDSQPEGTAITFYDFDNYEYFALDLIRKEFEGFKVKPHSAQTPKLSPAQAQIHAHVSTNTINYSTFNDSIESNQSDDTDFLFDDCILDSSDPFICESHLNLTFNACQNDLVPNKKGEEKSMLSSKLASKQSFAESNLSFIIYEET